jgi:sulfur carrier protein
MKKLYVSFSGKKIEISEGINLELFLHSQGVNNEKIATAVNNEFVAKSERNTFVLKHGDKITPFAPITGG